jgi:5-(aminomethyl)-3-furanmethanol phosphate kinase
VLGLRRDCRPLLVVGGGAAADVVRQWDAIHKPGDETTHDLAVLAMGLNEELLLRLLPESRPVRSARQFESAAADGMLPILCAHCFLKWGESAGHPRLRRSWDVTSDSIAVWTARVIRADECVLVKSVACPQGATAAEAARRGLVDACFAETAAGLPAISWSNARDAAPAIVPWLRQGIPVA